jgi:hypothetical protein
MQATFNVTAQVPGLTIQGRMVRETDAGISPLTVTLPPGKTGELTTRTDDDTGVVTMDPGHGLVQNDVVDVYWGASNVRYGMVIGVPTGDALPIDGGLGDALPSTATDLIVTKQVTINCAIDGDALAVLAVKAELANPNAVTPAHVGFRDAANDSIAELTLIGNKPRVFDIDGGDANPFTGDPITYLLASNGSSTDNVTLKLGGLVDSTP